jgi:hypothetical protein
MGLPMCRQLWTFCFFCDSYNLRAMKIPLYDLEEVKPTVSEQVDGALAAVSRDGLIAFVRERCMADAAFRQHFLVTCAPDAIDLDGGGQLKWIRSELEAIAGRKRYIQWDAATAAGDVLDDMLEQARKLLAKGHTERSVPMITAVIAGGSEAMQNADDSHGEISGKITAAMELLAEVATQEHEEAFRKKLLAEVQRLYADPTVRDCDWDGNLEPMAATLVRTEAEVTPVMAMLKRKASNEYSGSAARDALVDLTRRFEGDAAAAALKEGFIVYTDVRKRAVETAIEAADWLRAKQLAEEGSRVMRNGRPAPEDHYWTPFLLRIAQLTKDIPEVIRLARTLFLDGNYNAMEHYKLLHEHVPTSEWPAFAEKLLSALRAGRKGYDRQLIADICAAKERWDVVMDIARHEVKLRSSFHWVLDKYEAELARRYPEEVSTILAERAEAFASTHVPKHNDYVQAVRLLQRLKKIGAVQLAESLATNWRERLKRRKGLMAELKKL